MSRLLAARRPAHDEMWCRPWYLHEIHLSAVIINNLVIKVFDSQRAQGDIAAGGDDANSSLHQHTGSLKTVFDVKEWTGHMRYLLHKSHDGFALGAVRDLREPTTPIIELGFSHLSCKVLEVSENNHFAFKCLFENRKRKNRRQLWGFEFLFQINSESDICTEIKFGKVVTALGLAKLLDETNQIVYRQHRLYPRPVTT